MFYILKLHCTLLHLELHIKIDLIRAETAHHKNKQTVLQLKQEILETGLFEKNPAKKSQ